MISIFWRLSSGYRLRPWRSPYLRWRIETYSGISAESIGTYDFLRFCWRNRASLLQYAGWAASMKELGSKEPSEPQSVPS